MKGKIKNKADNFTFHRHLPTVMVTCAARKLMFMSASNTFTLDVHILEVGENVDETELSNRSVPHTNPQDKANQVITNLKQLNESYHCYLTNPVLFVRILVHTDREYVGV